MSVILIGIKQTESKKAPREALKLIWTEVKVRGADLT